MLLGAGDDKARSESTGLSFPLSTDGRLAAGKGSFDGVWRGAWERCQGPDLWAFESRLKVYRVNFVQKNPPASTDA